MRKVITVWILIIFIIAIQSCYKTSNVSDMVIELYSDKQIVIDSLDVDTIFVNENRLQKIRNLLLMNSLYEERDSLLQLNKVVEDNDRYAFNDSLRINTIQNVSAIKNNKLEHKKLILDIRKEIDQHRVKDVSKMKIYVIWYVKRNESRYSLVMDHNFDIIFAQDKQLIGK